MNYTYRYEIQGGGSAHYVKLVFDRVLSGNSVYRSGILREKASPKVCELMDAIADTPNVIKTRDNDFTGPSELIHVSGCEILVAVAPFIGGVNIPEVANQIIKKVQRRFAKGENRKRILYKDLEAKQKALNLKTWGD